MKICLNLKLFKIFPIQKFLASCPLLYKYKTIVNFKPGKCADF